MSPKLSIRELLETDIEPLSDYWFNASEDFLRSMGADINKFPSRDEWEKMLRLQIETPYEYKKAYCLIWLSDDVPVGHSNLNPVNFGHEGTMHLHMWNMEKRKSGMGLEFVKICLPIFFEKMKLNKIICEPYALNPAPNRTLEKAGFTFVKKYITTPGFVNFEQEVNRWEIKNPSVIDERVP